jgi:hypothetical protein
VSVRDRKWSIILPDDLNEKFVKACRITHFSPSALVGLLIEEGIDPYLSTEPHLLDPSTSEELGKAWIQLDRGIRPVVRSACQLLGMDESVLVSMVLREYLAAFIKQSKLKQDELAPLLGQRDAAPEEPSDSGEGTA